MNTLDNVDFILPVYIDHTDRLRNLKITLKYLKAIGATNIYVNEHYRDTPKAKDIIPGYICKDITNDEFYNKMVCGNEIFNKLSKNKVVCLYDVDVLLPKKDLVECTAKLLGGYDFGYPFNGYFYDVPIDLVDKLKEDLTTSIDIARCKLFARESHGGCAMFERNSFIEGGKLNPNFKNVGFDDDEINVRYLRLGYKKYRTASPLLHLTHFRGDTSYNFSKFTEYNGQECHKITTMAIENLKKYIKTW
jgi:hypothetical protein